MTGFEFSKRAELSPAAIYQIMNKTEKDITRPPRRSTVTSLAKTVGAKVNFQSDRGTFGLYQDFELPRAEAKERA